MFDRAARSKLRGVNGRATQRQGTNGASRTPDVVGQIARDLVLVVDTVPGASQSADIYQRRELLGGKGANQAVALAQLGMRPALAGVVGEDQIAQRLLTQARHDRVDVSAVVRRPGVRTALIVDIVDGTGRWRYLEDIPAEMLLTKGVQDQLTLLAEGLAESSR